MTRLDVEGIQVRFDGRPFLRDISLSVPSGELHVILGPSGSGKTTLLRSLAGLQPLDTGTVLVGGADVTRLAPERRGLALMHQEHALFPHLDVAQNVAFGLRLQGKSPDEIRRRTERLLDLVDLVGFESRRVDGLSGGEKQRVALARALAVEPRVLLLDEPLSAVDRALRQTLRADLRRILHERRITALYVTHDQEDAFALSDGLLVMDEGHIVDRGPVEGVFRSPASPAAARVLGRRNVLLYGRSGDGGAATAAGEMPLSPPGPEGGGILLLREEDLRFVEEPDGDATVAEVQFLGTRTVYSLRRADARLIAEQPGPPRVPMGARVRIDWARVEPVWYEPGGGPRAPYS